MRTNHDTDERGMALLLVVAVIALLSVTLLAFNDRTESAMERAFYFQDRLQLQAMTASGIDIGMAVLYEDAEQSENDNLMEEWSLLSGRELGRLFKDGTLRVEVSDLSGRFPINRLVSEGNDGPGSDAVDFRMMLLRLLASGEFAVEDEIEARTIVDSLTDWLDGDDQVLPYGAENDYYFSLAGPRPARNGPVEFIGELLQVRGMTAEILYGNDEKKGLAEYITIYGNDSININTAPPLLLQAMAPDISEEDVNIIDEFRTKEDSGSELSQPDWYLTVPGWPRDIVIEPSLITTTSSYFRLETAARYRTHTLDMTADIGRSKDELTIFYRSMY